MKKIIIIILVLVIGNIALAQGSILINGNEMQQPSCCCKLKHQIQVAGEASETYGTAAIRVVEEPGCQVCPYTTGKKPTPYWSGLCLLDSVLTIADVIRWIAMILVGVSLVAVGVVYMTAHGSEEKMLLSKKMLYGALTGILIATLSAIIPAIARYFIGI